MMPHLHTRLPKNVAEGCRTDAAHSHTLTHTQWDIEFVVGVSVLSVVGGVLVSVRGCTAPARVR